MFASSSSDSLIPSVSGSAAPGRRPLSWGVFIACVAGGLALRAGAILLSSPESSLPAWRVFSWLNVPLQIHSWPADHAAYLQWGRQAVTEGILTLYTQPPDPHIRVRLSGGESWIYEGSDHMANYPPLALYLIALEGWTLQRMELALHVGAEDAETPPGRAPFIANTVLARCAFQTLGVIFDFLLAWSVAGLAVRLIGPHAWRGAFSVMMVAPPIWLDSCWWGQTESWVMVPLVMMVLAMVERRWLVAGVFWGVALALKTQAILAAPVWAFVWGDAWIRGRRRDHPRDDWRIVAGGGIALATLNVIALPFWWTSGPEWFHQSFWRNLGEEAPHVTLRAFNVWYVDLLLTFDTSVSATWGGISKDGWGRGFALVGLGAVMILCGRTRFEPPGWRVVALTGLWLLTAVMLPTRVHERYLILCLPFLTVLALRWRRLQSVSWGLMLVAGAQVLSYHWLKVGAGDWSLYLEQDTRAFHQKALRDTPPELHDRLPTLDQALEMRFDNFRQAHRPYAPWEWGFTLLALACFVASFWIVRWSPNERREPPEKELDTNPRSNFPVAAPLRFEQLCPGLSPS